MNFKETLFFGQYLSLGQLSLNMQQASIFLEPEVSAMLIEKNQIQKLRQQLSLLPSLRLDVSICKYLVINSKILINLIDVKNVRGIR